MVGVHEEGGIDVRLADEHLLLVRGELIPLLQQLVRPGGELGVRRDHAQLLLVGEDLLPEFVPALVEQVQIRGFLDPCRRRMVRRMRAARHVIDEERLLRTQRINLVHVGDGLVRHRGNEIVAGVPLEGIDVGRVAGQVRRLPLVGVAAHEAVEVIEAHADGPLVEGPDGGGRLEGRRVVVLAEPRGAVAVVLQDLADGRLVPGDDAVVAGIARGLLRDDAEPGRVVVAAGDQGRPGGRAQGGGVEVGIAQPHLGDAVQGRRRDDAAEGAGRARSPRRRS